MIFLSACGGGKKEPTDRPDVKVGQAQLYAINALYGTYITDNLTRLPRSIDDLAAIAQSKGDEDPRQIVSPFASDEEPRGYALLERDEENWSKVWGDTVLMYDAAGEARGYPAVNVLFGSGAVMLVDVDELRRVLRAHGVAVSDEHRDVPGLEDEPGARKMYPLK